jgi:hypothetical protein
MTEHTQPSQTTREEEANQAQHGHDAGRGPTPDEEMLADESTPDPSVAAHEQEMLERGAHQAGEGRLP